MPAGASALIWVSTCKAKTLLALVALMAETGHLSP